MGPLLALAALLQAVPSGDPSSIFLEKGILGAIIVVLAGVIIYQQRAIVGLHGEVAKAKDARTADAQAVTKTILDIAKDHNEVNRQFVQALDKTAAMLEQVRDEVRRNK